MVFRAVVDRGLGIRLAECLVDDRSSQDGDPAPDEREPESSSWAIRLCETALTDGAWPEHLHHKRIGPNSVRRRDKAVVDKGPVGSVVDLARQMLTCVPETLGDGPSLVPMSARRPSDWTTAAIVQSVPPNWMDPSA
jgi:hypothetical protein